MKTIALSTGHLAVIDDSDYEAVAAHVWYGRIVRTSSRECVYADARIDGKNVSMHRFINGHSGLIDHWDGDGLNNRRHNLRSANRSQNGANRFKNVGSSSKFKGVSWEVRPAKWQARIMKNGVARYLGCYPDECDAAQVYNFVAEELFGEFARLNTPSGTVPATQPFLLCELMETIAG